MKRLAALIVMLAAMAVCVPTYGYVLVYDVTGMIKAVDIVTNGIDRTMIQGYLAVEVDEAEGTIVGTALVLYGRDEERNRVYMTSDYVNMTIYGDSVVVIADVGQGGSVVLTGGRMWARNIGLAGRRNVAGMLDGDIRVMEGTLFDLDQTLTGSGYVSAFLDMRLTREANSAAETLDDVIGGIIQRLEARGFAALGGEDEPPAPSSMN